MSVTLGDMVEIVRKFVKKPDMDLALVRQIINDQYKKVSRRKLWKELRRELNEDIALTSGTNYLTMPSDCAEVLSIADKTNAWSFRRKNLEDLISDHIVTLATSADPVYWAEIKGSLLAPLAIDDTIQITGEVSGDTSVEIRVAGLMASPEVDTIETIKTNSSDATTAVNSTVTYRKGWSISSISIGEPLNGGYIKITETTTTANVLAYIPKGQSASQYVTVRFESVPNAASDLNVIYKIRVPDLVDDYDLIMIPDAASVVVQESIAQLRFFDGKYAEGNVHKAEARGQEDALMKEDAQGDTEYQFTPDFRGRGLRRAY